MINLFKNGMPVSKYSLIERSEELLRLAKSGDENIFAILELSKRMTDDCKDKITVAFIDNFICDVRHRDEKLSRGDLSRLIDYIRCL